MMNEKKDLEVVDLKAYPSFQDKPYLFLFKTSGSNIKCITSFEREFYKEFLKAKEDYHNNSIACNPFTENLLDKTFSYLLDNYNFDLEKVEEGKKLYKYEQLKRIINLAKAIQENSLYDWSKKYGRLNIKVAGTRIFYLSDDIAANFHGIITIRNGEGNAIYVRRGLTDASYAFLITNLFWSTLKLPRNKSDMKLALIRDGDESNKVLEDGCYAKLICNFDKETRILTRNLLFPYEQVLKDLGECDNDNYKFLNKFEEYYLRDELKEHLLDCLFMKEYEDKYSAEKKAFYTKSIFQRFRKNKNS